MFKALIKIKEPLLKPQEMTIHYKEPLILEQTYDKYSTTFYSLEEEQERLSEELNREVIILPYGLVKAK